MTGELIRARLVEAVHHLAVPIGDTGKEGEVQLLRRIPVGTGEVVDFVTKGHVMHDPLHVRAEVPKHMSRVEVRHGRLTRVEG